MSNHETNRELHDKYFVAREEIKLLKHDQADHIASVEYLRHRLTLAEAVVEAVRGGMDYSGGRWCEWGERAEGVRDILDAALSAYDKGI